LDLQRQPSAMWHIFEAAAKAYTRLATLLFLWILLIVPRKKKEKTVGPSACMFHAPQYG
jgi:hypothetical protein